MESVPTSLPHTSSEPGSQVSVSYLRPNNYVNLDADLLRILDVSAVFSEELYVLSQQDIYQSRSRVEAERSLFLSSRSSQKTRISWNQPTLQNLPKKFDSLSLNINIIAVLQLTGPILPLHQ